MVSFSETNQIKLYKNKKVFEKLKMSVFISIAILLIIVLTILVFAMTFALLIITKLKKGRTYKYEIQKDDFTLRPTYQKSCEKFQKFQYSTVNRVDRRSIESFYWVPNGEILTIKRPSYENHYQMAQSTQSVFFV